MLEREGGVSEISDAFLAKARECLSGAASELGNGRYNNCANRCYYACFHAAIAVLDLAGVRPPGGRSEWGHSFVQSQFAGVLVNRRKRYPGTLRDTLTLLRRLRNLSDYEIVPVSEIQARRALRHARAFVTALDGQEE